MNKSEIIKVAQTCTNATIFVFSKTEKETARLHEEFVREVPQAEVCWGIRTIIFYNGSRIHFSYSLGNDSYAIENDICGLEITLAVMDNVAPTTYLRSRIRVGRCKNYEQFELPKLVQYD